MLPKVTRYVPDAEQFDYTSRTFHGDVMGTQRPFALAAFLVAIWLFVTACDTGGGGAPPAPAAGTSPAETTAEPASDASETPDAPPASSAERGTLEVVSDRLPYAEVDEQLVYGHFVFPANMVDPLPGIIVIHERWGLDDGTRALADRLAAQGYVVLAVDLFGGKTATDVSVARTLMLPVIENPDVANENIRQAYQFLIDTGPAPAIAALGWSFGGNWALNTALLFPDDLDAAVILYGQVTNNEEKLRPMNVPLLGIFGANDRGVTVETVREFEGVLESLEKDYAIEVYDDVGHAFADPTSSNYNPAVADQAWATILDFLASNLDNGAD